MTDAHSFPVSRQDNSEAARDNLACNPAAHKWSPTCCKSQPESNHKLDQKIEVCTLAACSKKVRLVQEGSRSPSFQAFYIQAQNHDKWRADLGSGTHKTGASRWVLVQAGAGVKNFMLAIVSRLMFAVHTG